MTLGAFIVPLLLALLLCGCVPTVMPADLSPQAVAARDLLAGARWQYRIGNDKWQDELTLPASTQAWVSGRLRFDAPDDVIAEAICLELTRGFPPYVDVDTRLNGHRIMPSPLQIGYLIETYRNIDKSLLKSTGNELTFVLQAGNGTDEPQAFAAPEMTLVPRWADELAFRTGPIISASNDEGFWLSCRTNLPADVRVVVTWLDGSKASEEFLDRSGDPLSQLFYVPREGNRFRYYVVARCDEAEVKLPTTTALLWTPDEPLRFVIHGDTQRCPEEWGDVSKAIVGESPAFVASIGDLNELGQADWGWDPEFFAPAAEMFATIPYFPGVGNHDVSYHSDIQNRGAASPLLTVFFVTPEGPGYSWAQQFDNVLMINIVGHQDFSVGSKRHEWLEGVLSSSDADYIFLLNHYPAWTSAHYGRLNDDGSKPRWYIEREQSETVIVPLMKKYGATALICGHDHFYQRSETPDGFTQVLTGTAGTASPYDLALPAGNNPHAVLGRGGLHYCLFEVTDDGCTMTVKRPNGDVVDTRTWPPREH